VVERAQYRQLLKLVLKITIRGEPYAKHLKGGGGARLWLS
jgi:hypothetical protein